MRKLFGKEYAIYYTTVLKELFSKLETDKKIIIIQVGDDLGSNKYIELKTKKASELGLEIDHKSFPNTATQIELEDTVKSLNHDDQVGGIMIQSPIPSLDIETIANLITPSKDFDGMSTHSPVLPAVDEAMLTLLDIVYQNYDIESWKKSLSETFDNTLKQSQEKRNNILKKNLKNNNICIVNDSIILGKPLENYFTNLGLSVKICNKYTPDISIFTREADLLITGTGVAGLIKSGMTKDGAIVFDCGFPTGDCAIEELENVAVITPVPGGVGPMTVACLFGNLYNLLKS